jgi:hypothetical protein
MPAESPQDLHQSNGGASQRTVTTRPLAPSERLVQRNRRLRRLLCDVLRYLEHPGRPELEMERRGRLADRIREQVDEGGGWPRARAA